MAELVGTLLWEMRSAANLTLGKLAQQAGVSKAALSRWEAGLCQPRVSELEAVLDALNASPAQRALALARIDAPRALRQLRHSPAPDSPGSPLTAGDLLRAMRGRSGWTQEQVAERLGVSGAAVARWELGERLPDAQQMQALCYALGAREEEIIALTSGRFREAPVEAEPTDWEEKEAELFFHIEAIRENRVGGLEDLHYIQLDREIWQWALREPAARLLLAQLRVYHAHYHRLHQRWELSRTMAQQAQQTLLNAPQPDSEKDLFIRLRLAIVQAATAVHGGVRPAPERGIRLLSPWVERSHTLPVFQAWLLSDIAKYLSLTGKHEEALALIEKACRLVTDNFPLELYLRRYDHSQLLLRAGRAQETLRVLPDHRNRAGSPEAVEVLLLQAEALRRLDCLTEAQDCLERAHTLIEEQDMKLHRPKAQALARQL